jgi:uncharacterized protein YdeI (YjbR/CyaY-like superfamily)
MIGNKGNIMNPAVTPYFDKPRKWQTEQRHLRTIALSSGLTEDLKWKHPCYTLNGANIFLIHAFNDYCAYLFHKGVLLKDPEGILIQQTKNVQSARQIRFTSLDQIIALEPTLQAYIQQAIEVERSGLKVDFKPTDEFDMPEELLNKLDADPSFNEAFTALTPGRQRGYRLYFSAPKQSATRVARIEKCVPQILKGKGLND